jgi:hypothetical protein
MTDEAVDHWVTDLEARQLSDLQFREVSRALRALSATYVERRERIKEGAALSGAGKRAAFAMFYGPLHFLLIREIVRTLELARPGPSAIVDLGCGTGVAGAAWASEQEQKPVVHGIDVSAWALGEAEHTWRAFGIPARARRADFATTVWPKGRTALVAAFAVNELGIIARRSSNNCLMAGTSRALEATPRIGRRTPRPCRRSVRPAWREVSSAGGRADSGAPSASAPRAARPRCGPRSPRATARCFC